MYFFSPPRHDIFLIPENKRHRNYSLYPLFHIIKEMSVSVADTVISSSDDLDSVYKTLCSRVAKKNNQDPNVYEGVWVITYKKRSPPDPLCLVNQMAYNVWLKSNIHYAAIFAEVLDENGQVTCVHLMGFVDKNSESISRSDNKIESQFLSMLVIDIITVGDQYMFNIGCLSKYIVPQTVNSIKEVRAIGTEFLDFYMVKSPTDLLASISDITGTIISKMDGIVNMISNRLQIYKMVVQLPLKPKEILSTIKRHAKSHKIGSKQIQCYQLMIMCIVCCYNCSFEKFFIHCEKVISRMLCTSTNSDSHVCTEHCDNVFHPTHLETVIGHFKDFKTAIESSKYILSVKTQIQKSIKENFGDISQVYETYVQNKKVEYIF